MTRRKAKVINTLVFILSLSACLSLRGVAQVVNDKIEDRSVLLLDGAPAESNTFNSSVQWQCVNKSLTKKCLVYHNDQWFQFTVEKSGRYYLNLSGQECRDLRGLQVIVIKGNPCETQSYELVMCLDKVPLDDLFIPVDSIEAGVPYLVNIDGFLEDYCSFKIQLATKPKGLPYRTHHLDDNLALSSHVAGIVSIQFQLPDSMTAPEKFEIYRLTPKESKFRVIAEFTPYFNAAGAPIRTYTHLDSLHVQGVYQYRVVAQAESGERTVIGEREIIYRDEQKASSPGNASSWYIYVPVTKGGKKQTLSTYLYDDPSTQLLDLRQWNAKEIGDTIRLDVTRYVKEGKRIFSVRVVQGKNQARVFIYKVNDETGQMDQVNN